MLAIKEYLRVQAITYAKRWAFGRNPLFNNYSGLGGDCTNFASQCLLAGALTMNYTETFGWYYRSDNDRAPAFTGVDPFYRFLTENEEEGPFGSEVGREGILPGDFIQLQNEEGVFYHTLVVLTVEEDDVLIAAHSDDAYARPLSSYTYAAARFIHIDGVRIAIPDEREVFYALLEGRMLPPENM